MASLIYSIGTYSLSLFFTGCVCSVTFSSSKLASAEPATILTVWSFLFMMIPPFAYSSTVHPILSFTASIGSMT